MTNGLGQRIAQLIQTNGPLSVAQFMTIALHDPAEGYYATRAPIGAAGDFITAPEISQIFGELVGLWCVQCWRDQGAPPRARLVEFGPGRATLMADALRAAKVAPEFLAAIEVELIEASPGLRAVQRERLKDLGLPIRFAERFEHSDRPLFVIANEFFDALPVRQFVFTERGWCERMVIAGGDGSLALALAPAAMRIAVEAAPPGAVHETCPAGLALAEDIAASIANEGGAALIIDYGYAEPGFGETLQAVGKHQFRDILEAPGEIDLSAHVDFAGLAAAAMRGGAQPFGPVSQARLLEALGIAARAAHLGRSNPNEAATIAAAVDRLTAKEQMGELFKALAILPAGATPSPGF